MISLKIYRVLNDQGKKHFTVCADRKMYTIRKHVWVSIPEAVVTAINCANKICPVDRIHYAIKEVVSPQQGSAAMKV